MNELVTEAPSNREYPYSSTGRKVRSSPIQLDKLVSKGFLDFEAEFIPSLNLNGLEFDDKNELEEAVDEDQGQTAPGDEAIETSRESSDADYEKVVPSNSVAALADQKVPTHKKGMASVDTTKTMDSVMTSSTANEKVKGGVERTKEQLLQTRAFLLDGFSSTLANHLWRSFRCHYLQCEIWAASKKSSPGDPA